MRYATMMAALLALVVIGCNKKDNAPAPAPAPQMEPMPKPTSQAPLKPADEELSTSPTPSVKPAPIPPDVKPASGSHKYVVKKGDTLIGIARRELGNEHRLGDLKAANPGIDPNKLKEGQEINLPAK